MKALCASLLLAMPFSAALAQTPGATRNEPEVRRIVLEDDAVRIEELRVRGQVQRILVSPKTGLTKPYEIVPADAARDLSQQRGLTGQRMWNLFSF